MRTLFSWVAAVVVGLGVSLAVVGCGSPTASPKDKMAGDKMGGKMEGDKMGGDKMGGDKMGDKKDKMEGDKK
jgi:pentapeptide MXKDX repeat protein